MKKNLFKIILFLLIILEITLIIFNYINKYRISEMLKIGNINDFYIQNLKELYGPGSESPIYIKFKINIDKYEKYDLQYMDISNSDSIFEGEITNKKEKISDTQYMCYYEKVIYSKREKDEFRKFKNDRIFLKVNSIILALIVLYWFYNITLKSQYDYAGSSEITWNDVKDRRNN